MAATSPQPAPAPREDQRAGRSRRHHGFTLIEMMVVGSFFFVTFGGVIALSLIVMFWAGPLALALFGPLGDEPVTYRQVRSLFPWKYIGFALGAFTLVFGLTSLIEGRIRWVRVFSSFLVVLALILIFDVPFDTILLPPNGDF